MSTKKYLYSFILLIMCIVITIFPAICRADWTASTNLVQFDVTSPSVDGLTKSITFTKAWCDPGTVHFRISDLVYTSNQGGNHPEIDDNKIITTVNGIRQDRDSNGQRKLWTNGSSNIVPVIFSLKPEIADYYPGRYEGSLTLDQQAGCVSVKIVINIQPSWIKIDPDNLYFYVDKPGLTDPKSTSVVIHTMPLDIIRVSLHVPSLKLSGVGPQEIAPEKCKLNVTYNDLIEHSDEDFTFTSTGFDPVIYSTRWWTTSYFTGVYNLNLEFRIDIDPDLAAGVYTGQYILTVDGI